MAGISYTKCFLYPPFERRTKIIDPHPDTLISPVDALITGVGTIEQGTILNVKGQTYTLKEMLEDEEQEKVYLNGHYAVLYLSPTDYHRIHSPIAGEIIKHVHKSGYVLSRQSIWIDPSEKGIKQK